MDLTMFKLFLVFAGVTLVACEITQQKITGDESSSSSASQSTESSLRSSVSTTQSPSPYAFSYNTADVAGNQLARQEAGDAKGAVRGSYSYRDADGLFRTVEYIADENGFRAAIRSNEPGISSSNKANELPASVYLQTEATPVKVASKVASATSLARAKAAQNTFATAAPTRPIVQSTLGENPTTTPQSIILASLAPSKVRVSPIKNSLSRVAPVAAARASVRQQRFRPQGTLRLVSSQVFSLPTTTSTTTTTTTQAPTTIAEQILSNPGLVQSQETFSSAEEPEQDSESPSQANLSREKLTQEQLSQENQNQESPTQQQNQESPVQQQQNQESPVQQQQNQESPVQQQQNQESPVQETPVPQSQVQESPVQAVPIQESPIQESPVQVNQNQESPVQESPVQESPVQESPVQEISHQESPVSGSPIQESPISIPESTFPQTSPVATEQPLLVRFLDEDLTYDSLDFQRAQAQPRTIAIRTAENPLSRLFRIVPIPHDEGLRLQQAGANMMYLTSAQSFPESSY